MEIGDRLRELLEKSGLTAYAFSKETGISNATLSRILNLNSKPNANNLQIITDYFKIDRQWFLTGILENKKDDVVSNAIRVNFSEMNVMFVPLVNKYAYGGYLIGYGDEEYIEVLPKIPFADDVEHKGEYLCFEVKGDSMDNDSSESYLEGDILLCRNVRQDFWKSKLHINKWDFVIVHKTDGILIKRIAGHDVENGKLILHSLNDFYQDRIIFLKDVMQIFNVVDIRRKRNRR